MSSLDLGLVAFKIEHEDCWTRLTSDYPITIRTLFAKPFKEKNVILGMDEIKVSKIDDFKGFMRKFKRHDSIHEIIEIFKVDIRRGIYRVLFKERYNGMLMSLLNTYTIFYYKDLIKNGYERLILIMPLEEANTLKLELKALGKLFDFRVKNVNINSFIPTFFDLSKQERYVIMKAVEKGYYNYPREVNLEELGNTIGLSKPTLEEYIRKAENKIMRKIFNEIMQYDLLLEDE